MTNKEISIAVARACGWTQIEDRTNEMGAHADVYGYPPTNFIVGKPERIPNYAQDLNAMRDAERVLTPSERVEYVAILTNRRSVTDDDITTDNAWKAINATAQDRAKAFLRALSK